MDIGEMSIQELHFAAMEIAAAAAIARDQGREEDGRDLSRRALEFEAAAAMRIPRTYGSEPTRSILYKSAASLALCAERREDCKVLAMEGLSGFPPASIAESLRELIQAAKENEEGDCSLPSQRVVS